MVYRGTIASKINVTPKMFTCSFEVIHLILAVANLLAHNKTSQICYCGQISIKSAAVKCNFSNNLTPYGDNIYFSSDGSLIGFNRSPGF